MKQSDLCAAWTLSRLAVAATLSVLGCASPGPPRPPSLHLPGLADSLTAQRAGGEVRLTWFTPATTTDGDTIRGKTTAILCREVARSNSMPHPGTTSCPPLQRITVTPGPTEATDLLSPDLSTGTPTLLRYQVELVNDRGKSAGMSVAAYATAGNAPEPVGSLIISARREAALIQWRAQPALPPGTFMEIRRTLTAGATGPVQPGRGADPRAPLSKAGLPRSLKPSSKTATANNKGSATEVTLLVAAAAQGAPTSADPGGTIDRGVRDGEDYLYSAQRVRKVTLEGHDLEMQGVASPPASFAYRDTFPPRMPSGLVSVPGGGFGAAPSIDLSWEPNPESDLLGYNVYRREDPGPFRKLNREPVSIASFRDMEVRPGHAYTYRVTAVDQRTNESQPSPEIHEGLKQ